MYRAIEDLRSESEGLVRVIDESGEDCLYTATSFSSLYLEEPQGAALEAMLPTACWLRTMQPEHLF